MHSQRLIFALLPLLFAQHAAGFTRCDISHCRTSIASALQTNPVFGYDDTVFANIPAGPDNATLWLHGCEMFCAANRTIVDDCPARLVQWFLPVLFLVVSVITPPMVPWARVWIVLRPVADPWSAVFALAYHIELAHRCCLAVQPLAAQLGDGAEPASAIEGQVNILFRMLTKLFRDTLSAIQHTTLNMAKASLRLCQDPPLEECLALVLLTLVEMEPGSSPTTGLERLRSLLQTSCSATNKRLVGHVYTIASKLMDNRSHSTLQAVLTTIFCAVSILIATVPAVGGSTPSGAMVAAALTLSPLITVVLLSNAIGAPASLRRVQEIMNEFDERCTASHPGPLLVTSSAINAADLDSLVFTSGTTWYQPRRSDKGTLPLTAYFGITTILLLTDFILSFAAAFVALAGPPAYVNDRHWVLVGLFFAWVANALTSRILIHWLAGSDKEPRSYQRLGLYTGIKDLAVALAVAVLFSATTCGWLSTCRIWANMYGFPGRSSHTVPLNNDAAFHFNNYTLYPWLVGVCLGSHFLTYILIRWFLWPWTTFRLFA
ncbi:hypothetical protein BAUCODRAFT_163744 [Baudoinia panamericana UAMH 10762]|uniref:Uncharacterized protein n=1 Tax=Baudoinia panamericana (strain UAMH 10762) TaxID=717646 RepID=M2N8E4_BAUPA|nr:uncharacterized protein BAUCODRAFT_163744 [Baudoinia panamericana UAMH 10762]EMD00414.1 hypothetical protein BAUCODRAFT_163744 [Baudoinia panamericana UAMH 10762]